MMKQIIALITFSTLVACSSQENKKDNHDRNDSKASITQFSEIVKDTFYINVQLPHAYSKNPDKSYPVVFLLDGNFYFPMMCSIFNQYEIAWALGTGDCRWN